jgi:hypothetical protein
MLFPIAVIKNAGNEKFAIIELSGACCLLITRIFGADQKAIFADGQ